jgi:predicted dienelactone hydrolase
MAIAVALSACSDDGGGENAGESGAADAAVQDGAADNDATAAPATEAEWQALSEPGPWGIGYRKTEVTYTGPGEIGERTIDVHVWYPTEATEGDHPPPYGGLVVDTQSLVDAAPAEPPAGAQWPVMVYTHGHQGFAGSSAFLPWHFVSRGWVVAAPDHKGNLLSDAIIPRPLWMYYARSFDMEQTIDLLEDLGSKAAPAGLAAADDASVLDTDHVLMTGHSFGAHTIWSAAGASYDEAVIKASCADGSGRIEQDDCDEASLAVLRDGLRDERVVAGVAMDGVVHRGLMGEGGHNDAAMPVLQISGDKEEASSKKDLETCDGCPMTWVDIDGATHQSFAVTCSASDLSDPTCPSIRRWALAFGLVHVLGDTAFAPWVRGEGSAYAVGVGVRR